MSSKQTAKWQSNDNDQQIQLEFSNFDEAWEMLHFTAKLIRSTGVFPKIYTQDNHVSMTVLGHENPAKAERFMDGVLDYLQPRKDKKAVSNTTNYQTADLYTDGGSRGNPGVSASGFVLYSKEEHEITRGGEYLGITTNNQAEYHSLKLGLEVALEQRVTSITIHMDSQLVVNQVKGVYKVKNRDLWPLYQACKDLLARFDDYSIVHVPRELNKVADGMVNKILDENKENGL